ncbi:hypothetical protein PTKIN_Ptkin07bG0109800 [Pterospermum kingtungense]
MKRSTRVGKPDTSNADLLTWTEASPSASSNTSAQRSSARSKSNQPSDVTNKAVFGGQVTDDKAQSLFNKKPSSGYKMKEKISSGIFSANNANVASRPTAANSTNKKGLCMYEQAVNGISRISFSADGSVSPKNPTSLPRVAKRRELRGTLQSELDAKSKKQISISKYKEISGHDIFAPLYEIESRSLAAAPSKESRDIGEPAPRNMRTSVKVSNPAGGQTSILLNEEPVVRTAKKIYNKKFQDLTGNDIFKGDVPPASPERPLSQAKLREMSGSGIFSEGKVEARDYLGGVRKPPGGESSIALG